MDTTISQSITRSLQSQAPAYLFVGDHQTLDTQIVTLLQKILCPCAGKKTLCITCNQISERQHYAISWFNPEKQHYSADEVQLLLNSIAYQLGPEEHHYIIINQAHALSTLGANALLKSLEEPPMGYHFFLLTHAPDTLPATIISRCLVQKLAAQDGRQGKNLQIVNLYPFLAPFLPSFQGISNPISFLKELETSKIDERESMRALNLLLELWVEAMKMTPVIIEKNPLIAIKQAFWTPPMPGSSKLFWKNLFLRSMV